MISVGSKVYSADNSGVVHARCLKVVGGSNPLKKGKAGDVIILTLTKVKSGTKVENHQLKKALVIGCKYANKKRSGVSIQYAANYVVILDDRLAPLGNRINNFTISNLRFKNYMKIVSLSFGIL